MVLSPRIWKVDDVKNIVDRVKAIIQEELLTMEYTAAGNSYRRQFACPLLELMNACDEYLSLYGSVDQLSPDSSTTRTFIVN